MHGLIEMETKLSKLAAAAMAGDWQAALRIAAKFPSLGDERDAIKRAHEAHANPAFYQQIGKDPEALIAAGIAALKRRYPKQLATLIDGETEMTTTNLTGTDIAKLTAVITGGGFKRAASKDAAASRFRAVLAEKIGEAMAETYAGDILGAADFQTANDWLATALDKRTERKVAPPVSAKAGAARKAALNLGKEPEAKPAKAAKAPKADKPVGKRAAILAAAEAGVLPDAPDFSAETHKSWRKKLAEVVALAEAGDIKGLRAYAINPYSSSPKAIAKYRDLCVIALEAQRKTAKAA